MAKADYQNPRAVTPAQRSITPKRAHTPAATDSDAAQLQAKLSLRGPRFPRQSALSLPLLPRRYQNAEFGFSYRGKLLKDHCHHDAVLTEQSDSVASESATFSARRYAYSYDQ